MASRAGEEGVNVVSVSARYEKANVRRLEEMAYELGGPHVEMSRAAVIRAALRDYFEKYEGSLETCDPVEHGGLGGGPAQMVCVKLEESERRYIEKVAYDLGGPQSSVSKSDVLRAAVRDYIEKYEGGVRECRPSERGGLKSPLRE